MDLVTCPHCQVEVVLTADGHCPSCRRFAGDASQHVAANPYESPPPNPASSAAAGMTTGEKIFTALVIVWTGFLLVSLAAFHFILIPGAEDPGVLYFVATIIWLTALGLAITTGLNLYYRSLLVIPTVVQCFVLCLMVYLIPFGIWGGVLLYWRMRRERTSSHATVPSTGSP